MTDLENVLRETFHAQADKAPLEHQVIARSLCRTTHPTSRRVRQFATGAATLAVAATVITGFSMSQHRAVPTMTDASTSATSHTAQTTAPTSSQDPSPAPNDGAPTLALNQYTNAVTEKIVTCLQGKGFPVVLDKESEFTDGAGRRQLTFSAPRAVRDSPGYHAAGEACTEAAEASVPSPSS